VFLNTIAYLLIGPGNLQIRCLIGLIIGIPLGITITPFYHWISNVVR
jgi:hypothetical protein